MFSIVCWQGIACKYNNTFHLLEWLKFKTLATSNADEDVEHQELSVIAAGDTVGAVT